MATVVFLFIVLDSFLHYQRDPKGCEISYMRPQYFLMTGFDHERTRFASKYRLYLYREGGYDTSLQPTGIPVLFIPGNAGSYKQVRSIAGNAAEYYYNRLRHEQDSVPPKALPLDVFTVDFNEEITALHGISLLEQAEYLNDAIQYILSLYELQPADVRATPPFSVLLIGHSMGGVVARTLFTLPNHAPGSVNTIITLSSPHLASPAPFDQLIVQTYRKVNEFWRFAFLPEEASTPSTSHGKFHNHIARDILHDVAIVSIAGGNLDTMIWSDVTNLEQLVPPSNGFTVFSTSIPHVWLSMDHACILWCKQLMDVLTKVLFGVTDARRPGQTLDLQGRMLVFRKYLLTSVDTETEQLIDYRANTARRSSDTLKAFHWSERLVLSAQRGKLPDRQSYFWEVPEAKLGTPDTFALLAPSEAARDLDVRLCRFASGRAARRSRAPAAAAEFRSDQSTVECVSVASLFVWLPAAPVEHGQVYRPPTYAFLPLKRVRWEGWNFVEVTAKTEAMHWVKTSFLVAEFYDEQANKVEFPFSMTDLALGRATITLKDGSVPLPFLLDIRAPVVDDSMLAYHLNVHISDCIDDGGRNATRLFPPILRQHTAVLHESKFTVGLQRDLDLNFYGRIPASLPALLSPPPNGQSNSGMVEPRQKSAPFRADERRGLNLQIWHDPTCRSETSLHLSLDVYGSLGRMVKALDMATVVFPYVGVMMVMAVQLKAWNSEDRFPTFPQALSSVVKGPLIPIAMSLGLVARFQSAVGGIPLPKIFRTGESDPPLLATLLIGARDPTFWFLPPALMFLGIGILVVWWMALAAVVGIICAVARAAERRGPGWITSLLNRPCETRDQRFRRRFITTVVLFVFVATLIPRQFVFLVSFIVQMFSCVKSRMKALAQKTPQQAGLYWNLHQYQMTVLLLLFTLLPFALPMLVVWIRNVSVLWFNPGSSDHNVMAVLPVLIYVEVISGKMIPKKIGGSRMTEITPLLLYAAAVGTLAFCMRDTYLVYTFSAWLVTWLALLHITCSPAGRKSFRLAAAWWQTANKMKP